MIIHTQITKRFTRSRGQLIRAALFAPMGTLFDTRYDKYIETRVEEKIVTKERIVIGDPYQLTVYRYADWGEARADGKRNGMYCYALSPEIAFERGDKYCKEAKADNNVVATRALRIGDKYFLVSQVSPVPIDVATS